MTSLSKNPLSLAILAVFFAPNVWAADVVTTDDVNVTATEITDKAPSSTTVGHKRIAREMIRDMRDLTRYEQDLGLQEEGRFNKGFTMRGVEGNRVGILVDGVSLPNFEENSLYARYGNMNTSRPTVDPELVTAISIDRGSNSVETGSGAVGGSVNFRTLNPEDIVDGDKRWGALGRVGYATKNREWLKTVSAAWRGDSVSALLLYSHRHGHNNKSLGRGNIYLKADSQHPDPSVHNAHTYLAKLRYHFNDMHSVGLNVNGTKFDRMLWENSRNHNNANELTQSNDISTRHSATVDYTFAPYNDYLNKLKLSGEALVVDTKAITEDSTYTMGYDAAADAVVQKSPWYVNSHKDRSFKTKFGRVTLEAQSAPIEFYGEHNFDMRAFASKRMVKNINLDHTRPFFSDTLDPGKPYTIQRPVDTTDRGLVLGDNIFWNSGVFRNHDTVIGLHLGGRIEKSSHQPKPYNAACSEECKGFGEVKDPKRKSFTNKAFNVGVDLEVDRAFKLGYNIGTGFRNPSATELYFKYENPYGNWLPNPDLRPEKSLTQNVFLQLNNRYGTFNINAFHINYKDFLFEDELWLKVPSKKWWEDPVQYYTLKMVNLEKAKIHGFEASGSFNLDTFSDKLKGAKLVGSIGMADGETGEGLSILPIQPLKYVYGIDYEHPSEKWGIYARGTYLGAKKETDTYHRSETGGRTTWKWRNKEANIFDLFGWWKPYKNVTLRAGVYNITNKRYQTWDSLRGILDHSKVNHVNDNGLGLERYYQPGRNYNMTLEVKF